MDKFDQIILAEISADCRKSVSDIGKRIRRSPQFVHYRLEQLKQKNIQLIPPLLNFTAYGFIEVTALIDFRIVQPIEEKQLIDELFKMTNSYKIFYSSGTPSIICSFLVEQLDELPKIKSTLLEQADIEIEFMVNYKSHLYALDYLGDQSTNSEFIISSTMIKPMDHLKPIFKMLQSDPLMPSLEISQKTNLTYDQVRYTLKHMKPILNNTLVISPRQVSRVVVFVNSNDIEFLHRYAKMHKHITEINYLTGKYDAYFIIESTQNVTQLAKIIIYELKDILRSYHMQDIVQIYKYGWFGL